MDSLAKRCLKSVAQSLFLIMVMMTGVAHSQEPTGDSPTINRQEETISSSPMDETATANIGPREVVVGIYVSQIRSLSLKDNEFVVDFYVWFRWKGDDIEPHKTFELVGGDAEKVLDDVEVRKLETSGENYVFVKVKATITQFWDVTRFPLDNHELVITLEDSEKEEDKLVYVPDYENTQLSDEVKFPGWSKGKERLEVDTHVYSSNYGDLDTGSESRYSRLKLVIPARRQGFGYFLKLFSGLFVATSIAQLVFFIKPSDVDPRFGLGAGAIFAAVASEYVVTSSLPDTNILTLADSLHILSFFVIFLTIAESVFSLFLFASENPAKKALSKRLDRASFFLLAPSYVVANVYLILYS